VPYGYRKSHSCVDCLHVWRPLCVIWWSRSSKVKREIFSYRLGAFQHLSPVSCQCSASKEKALDCLCGMPTCALLAPRQSPRWPRRPRPPSSAPICSLRLYRPSSPRPSSHTRSACAVPKLLSHHPSSALICTCSAQGANLNTSKPCTLSNLTSTRRFGWREGLALKGIQAPSPLIHKQCTSHFHLWHNYHVRFLNLTGFLLASTKRIAHDTTTRTWIWSSLHIAMTIIQCELSQSKAESFPQVNFSCLATWLLIRRRYAPSRASMPQRDPSMHINR
jgi:hypothetical protein